VPRSKRAILDDIGRVSAEIDLLTPKVSRLHARRVKLWQEGVDAGLSHAEMAARTSVGRDTIAKALSVARRKAS
jgi:hypothetical protein